MRDTDRDIILALAKSLNMDFDFLGQIIDGKRNAGPTLAGALGLATGTKAVYWQKDGQEKTRLVAVKVWAINQKRLDISPDEPEPRRRPCPHC